MKLSEMIAGSVAWDVLLLTLLRVENIVMTWSIQEEHRRLAIIGEVVSNYSVLSSVKVFDTNTCTESCTDCNDVNVIAFLVHCLYFLRRNQNSENYRRERMRAHLMTELGDSSVAPIDKVLIEV